MYKVLRLLGITAVVLGLCFDPAVAADDQAPLAHSLEGQRGARLRLALNKAIDELIQRADDGDIFAKQVIEESGLEFIRGVTKVNQNTFNSYKNVIEKYDELFLKSQPNQSISSSSGGGYRQDTQSLDNSLPGEQPINNASEPQGEIGSDKIDNVFEAPPVPPLPQPLPNTQKDREGDSSQQKKPGDFLNEVQEGVKLKNAQERQIPQKKDDLLDKVQKGVKLRPAEERVLGPEPKETDPRSDLLDQVRKGTKLKETVKKSEEKSREKVATGNPLFDAVADKMSNMRKDIAPDDEGDAEWDD